MRQVILVFLCACVSGCGANFNSIFRDTSLDENKVSFIDAKQRAIISQNRITTSIDENDKITGTVSHPVTCAEPSPDVFSVLSSSLAASGTFEEPGGPSAAAAFAASISETGTNIGLRTQSIQLLRDMMYRVCERYMNQAISAFDLRLQAARDQRLVTTLLAIEQLTGAVRPQPIVISNSASADTGAGLVAAQKSLDAAREDFTTKKAAADKAETDAKAAEDSAKAKEAEAAAEQDPTKKQNLTTEAKSLRETAVKKKTDAATKKAAADEAAANVKSHEEKRDAARTVQSNGVSATQIGDLPNDCCKLNAQDTQIIAATIEKLVTQVFEDDEIQYTCLSIVAEARRKPELITTTPTNAFEFCLTYLANDTAELKLNIQRIDREALEDLNMQIEKLKPTQE